MDKHFTLTIIFIVLTTLKSVSQTNELPVFPIDKVTGKITYTEVVYLDSTITKQELFTTAREWFAKTFKSATDVLKMDDKEEGVLIGKGSIQAYNKVLGSTMEAGVFLFTISMYFKDGRYKYEITDLLYSSDYMKDVTCEHLYNAKEKDTPMFTKKGAVQYFNQLKMEMDNLIKNLKVSMAKTRTSDEVKW